MSLIFVCMWHIWGICLCMCTRTCGYPCTRVEVQMMARGPRQLSSSMDCHLILIIIYIFFLVRASDITWSSLISPRLTIGRPSRIHLSPIPSRGITNECHNTCCFAWVPGIQAQMLTLPQQAIFPCPSNKPTNQKQLEYI